jgi:uncharacterized protein YhfF
MKVEAPIQTFWQAYLASLPEEDASDLREVPEAWGFGDTTEMADELGALVYEGKKTATCSLLWEHEVEGEPLPQVGTLSIITDGKDEPLCVVETTEVEIRPYNEVDEQFAFDEGEGDQSLAYWREEHWRFFSEICADIDHMPDETMPLVCERFRVVFRV